MPRLRVPALALGLALIGTSVAVGVVSARSAQSHAEQQDTNLSVAARQVATSLTQVFERVRTIDLMLAHQPAFAAFVTDPRPLSVRLGPDNQDLKDINGSLRFLDQLLVGQLDTAGFADIHGHEIARYADGRLALIPDLGSVKSEPFFRAPLLMGANAVYRTDPFQSDRTNNWVVGHSTLVTDSAGKGVGVVYFTITMDSLRTAMLGTAQNGEDLRVVDGKSGQVVMDSRVGENALLNSAAVGLKPVLADDRDFAGTKLLRRSGTGVDGHTRLAFASISNAQQDVGSGWVVVASGSVVGVGSGWLGWGWWVWGLLGVGVVLVLVGVWLWVGVVRVARRVGSAMVAERDVLAVRLGVVSEALSRVGAGDLGVVLPVEELGAADAVLGGLVGGFEDTIGRLRVLVGSAQEAGELVAASAAELLVLAGRQADSAGEQSAAVTETTVTIQQLAATASQIAESAGGVAAVAGEMLGLTESGRVAVSESVAAMSKIAARVGSITDSAAVLGDKVAEIGGILVLLDELSDQTNLLALNAAIEAARAGEHGRGFAVVAGEVRKLAERARVSTARIQGLVSEIGVLMAATVTASAQGAAEVRTGSALAADAVAALDQIAGRVEEAATSVKEISVATNQQRSASDQVVVAMTRLSQVSTMYAAGSRQAAAAAQELAALATTMQTSIETFRTNTTEDNAQDGEAAEAVEDVEAAEELEAVEAVEEAEAVSVSS